MASEQMTQGEAETLVLTDDSRDCHQSEPAAVLFGDAPAGSALVSDEAESSDPFDAGLTLQEAAYVYGYSKKTLRTLIEEGRLPAVQVETGRKKKLKWKVFPSGVPEDFFEAIASSKVAEPAAENFPAPPVEAQPEMIALPEIEIELPAESIAVTEVEIETPGKAKKRKKKKNKSKHKEAKTKKPVEESLDFSIPPADEQPVPEEEEWTSEQEALFNALLARLYTDERDAVAEGALGQSPVAEVGSSVTVEQAPTVEPPAVENLETLLDAVVSPGSEAIAVPVSADSASEESCTVFDALDENGLLPRLANLEGEVSQLMHKNAYLENRVAELEATLKVLTGSANGKMRTQTMLFMIPFLLVLCAAATAYLR